MSSPQVDQDPNYQYRDCNYRLINHQKGKSGNLLINLCEAKELRRPVHDWSMLSLGPVKHLGLSHKHGPVSAYVRFFLSCPDVLAFQKHGADNNNNNNNNNSQSDDHNRIFSPLSTNNEDCTSPTIPRNNSPTWTDRNTSNFTLQIDKTNLQDGSPLYLSVEVYESHSTVESVLPGSVKGGQSPMATGQVDVTNICLGLEPARDVWINLNCKQEDNVPAGKVRVILAYESIGIEPQKDDIVCLEPFARNSSFILPSSTLSMKVLNRLDAYLHIQYKMKCGQLGTLKIHRNSVFVVERLNLLDGVIDFAMKPSDMFFSSGIGKEVAKISEPVAGVVGDFAKPVVLTGQLIATMGIGSINTIAKVVAASTGGFRKNSS